MKVLNPLNLDEGYICFVRINCNYICRCLDQLLSLDFLLITTKTLFVFKECLSIKENLEEVGIGLPKDITDAIETINPDKENKEE